MISLENFTNTYINSHHFYIISQKIPHVISTMELSGAGLCGWSMPGGLSWQPWGKIFQFILNMSLICKVCSTFLGTF